jgi:hypothetical protein
VQAFFGDECVIILQALRQLTCATSVELSVVVNLTERTVRQLLHCMSMLVTRCDDVYRVRSHVDRLMTDHLRLCVEHCNRVFVCDTCVTTYEFAVDEQCPIHRTPLRMHRLDASLLKEMCNSCAQTQALIPDVQRLSVPTAVVQVTDLWA